GPNAAPVEAFAGDFADRCETAVQAERLGTAHAVLTAREAISRGYRQVMVLYGDTPLLTADTLRRLSAVLDDGAAVAVLGFEPGDPTGYGRLVVEGGNLVAIREERDATPEEKKINLCNSGVMAFAGDGMLTLLDAIDNDNAKGEYYLTDAVALANSAGLKAAAMRVAADEVIGVNNRAELAAAEAIAQARYRSAAMEAGATLIDPATVYFSHDTRLGRDVVIEPCVWFGEGVEIADGAVVHAFSYLAGTRVGPGASVGPSAHLRLGTDLGEGVKVGAFVETKAASFAKGSKANHLAYVGDAAVGEKANIGAGVITCNYDGVSKHRTTIGDNAFIGSNSALVAPVSIGEGAYVGSGSVITEDVSPGALALGRGRQVEKPDWAAGRPAKGSPKKD
ncbi:MAG: bifunctional UDP-N-acetylglucosamine diphosphorylase/glucosamine-1-phosphate N-acetyltransferase GlmU, partial [Flavobacteriaceae bacterium]